MLLSSFLLAGCRDPSDPTGPPPKTPPVTEPDPPCVAPPRPQEGIDGSLNRVFGSVDLQEPTAGILQTSALPGWWYAWEKTGRVVRFADDPAADTMEVVLDLTSVVDSDGEERGLLGMAFHPDFATNGWVFLDYTVSRPGLPYATVLSRFTSPDGGATLDPASELLLIYNRKVQTGHNGGNLAFGPDGYLYSAWGDGGVVGDPDNYAQDLDTLFGKVLRIDVDDDELPVRPYAIPPDNPFALGGGRPEIWAWGFRNPWRWTFDSVTGDLWLGDVGHQSWEEIDLVVGGGNYGWHLKEGATCYTPLVDCDPLGETIDPVLALQHVTVAAVIAGVVYRGAAFPELDGKLLFNDYVKDDVFVLEYDPLTGAPFAKLGLSGSNDLVHWATGNDGEAYALSLDAKIYRLEPRTGEVPPPFPPTLSETGCTAADDPRLPDPALVPFSPAQPFWSDGLDKVRWLSVPPGKQLDVNGLDLGFPVGTVLLKELRDGERRVETRLFVRHDDGWAGYTYLWRADQSEADLLEGTVEVDLGDQVWTVPSRNECFSCHTQAAGRALGLELPQLDHDLVYPDGTTANQLDHLVSLGLLDPDVEHPGPFPAIDGPEPVELRARAWLHVNCSPCHQPTGGTPVDLDLRFTTDLRETGLCGEPTAGDLGLEDALLIAPGEPERSVVVQRAGARGLHQMPPIGTDEVDVVGLGVLTEWVAGLPSCP